MNSGFKIFGQNVCWLWIFFSFVRLRAINSFFPSKSILEPNQLSIVFSKFEIDATHFLISSCPINHVQPLDRAKNIPRSILKFDKKEFPMVIDLKDYVGCWNFKFVDYVCVCVGGWLNSLCNACYFLSALAHDFFCYLYLSLCLAFASNSTISAINLFFSLKKWAFGRFLFNYNRKWLLLFVVLNLFSLLIS